MTQTENSASVAAGVPAHVTLIDATRVEQLVAFARDLLIDPGDPRTLADRVAQRATLLVGARAAAVGAARDGRWALLGTYDLSPAYVRRWEGIDASDDRLRAALAGGRAAVCPEPDGTQTLLLPMPGPGALHLVWPPEHAIGPEAVERARVMALLAGAALENVRQQERLQRVARWKSDALTAMAHDLRAPLNALVGYAGLLAADAYGALTPEQRDVCATLERQAFELVDLLGAALDVARVDTGKLPVRDEEFALGDVLDALRAGTFAKPAGEGRLTFRVPLDLPALRSDRVKVKEIVQNLVGNALDHGGGSAVELDVAVSERDTLRLTVRDAGPGIAADVLPYLFEPFRTGARTGTGFGLYLVRSFVEALGGRVAARSAPGEGTAITVELPLAPHGAGGRVGTPPQI